MRVSYIVVKRRVYSGKVVYKCLKGGIFWDGWVNYGSVALIVKKW